MPKIKGGYYLKARKAQESWIAHQPPHVREIWDYLLREANHSDRKYSGFIIKRGQLFRTYKEIREALHWKIGYRKMRYHENLTKHSMKALRDALMITTMKQLGGVLITICNYSFYQNPQNYETTSDLTNEATNEPTTYQPSSTYYNKNDKNDKELKEKKKTYRFIKPSIQEIHDYCKLRNNDIDAEAFYDHYESIGWKRGKTPIKNWQATVRTWEKRNKTEKEKFL